MDSISQILSMFFMVTYGALCAVSFLEYFAGNPFEFDRDHTEEVHEIVKGVELATSSKFNACVLRSTIYRFGYRSSIHIWLTDADYDNASLMILLSCIIVGHPDWRKAEIQLFTCFAASKAEEERTRLEEMMREGRLPISSQRIASVPVSNPGDVEIAVARYSRDADLVIFGLTSSDVFGDLAGALSRSLTLNDVLFVNASEKIPIL